MIKENLEQVNLKIADAAKNSPYGQDVTLIAVSKTKPASCIEEAYAAGQRDFGENKVQELCDKYEVLPKDIRWHLIGHLQTNKVKYVVGKTCLIHSVDSLHLAEEIERQAGKKGCDVDILIQVNISHEESKSGFDSSEVTGMIRQIAKLEHVHIRGLMTIAPLTDDKKLLRNIFRELKNLSIDIDELNIDNTEMSVLSMGMSGDFYEAIEEGSTMVRIGTAIFGERNYNI